MRTLTVNEALSQFDQFIDMAQREPVRVMQHDQVVGLLVSTDDFEAMRLFYANRLQHSLAASSAQAVHAGMTHKRLQELLHEDS